MISAHSILSELKLGVKIYSVQKLFSGRIQIKVKDIEGIKFATGIFNYIFYFRRQTYNKKLKDNVTKKESNC